MSIRGRGVNRASICSQFVVMSVESSIELWFLARQCDKKPSFATYVPISDSGVPLSMLRHFSIRAPDVLLLVPASPIAPFQICFQ